MAKQRNEEEYLRAKAEKSLSGYGGFYLAKATYGRREGIELLRRAISSAEWVDENFVASFNGYPFAGTDGSEKEKERGEERPSESEGKRLSDARVVQRTEKAEKKELRVSEGNAKGDDSVAENAPDGAPQRSECFSRNGFAATEEYIPLYRMSGRATYVWSEKEISTDKKNGGEIATRVGKREERGTETMLFFASEQLLKADDPPSPLTALADDRLKEIVYASGGLVSFAENARALKKTACARAPAARARSELSDVCGEVIFIPLLTVKCVFGGQEYCNRVNLCNGRCETEYPFSDRLSEKASRIGKKVAALATYDFFAGLFAAVFAVLGAVKFFRGEGERGGMNLGVLIVLAALVLLPVFAFWRTRAYRGRRLRDRMREDGTKKSLFPLYALAVLSWAAALLSLILFACAAL